MSLHTNTLTHSLTFCLQVERKGELKVLSGLWPFSDKKLLEVSGLNPRVDSPATCSKKSSVLVCSLKKVIMVLICEDLYVDFCAAGMVAGGVGPIAQKQWSKYSKKASRQRAFHQPIVLLVMVRGETEGPFGLWRTRLWRRCWYAGIC